ncbi:hypothetical protein HU200_021141 [Digitaria exilis]|uniref:Uncharacterized protein n=1 Tax=Digitaria exilis TaxID=1010633 RepID=A0A835EZW6_9POAL|nr:hypothetical protein HU200_021141 [Digitaria exilis]
MPAGDFDNAVGDVLIAFTQHKLPHSTKLSGAPEPRTSSPSPTSTSSRNPCRLPCSASTPGHHHQPPLATSNQPPQSSQSRLPTFLNHFFPLAGRIASNPRSGLPEVHCGNQGAELVVGEASVTLASLDYGRITSTLRQFQLPYDMDVALSVQLVSFTCGGFTVAWCTSHVLMDASSMILLVNSWSEHARSGALPAGVRPNHDRSLLASLHEAFTPLDKRHQVNVLTTQQSMVERLILNRRAASHSRGARATRIQAISAYLWKALANVVGEADECCRMGWWVDGRSRLTTPKISDALTNYIGNVIAFVVREERVQELVRMPLADVAAMVREAIAAPVYDEHFQELVDWVEEHKAGRYVDTASIGLGSPALRITAAGAAWFDTDFFGLGQQATLATVTATLVARLCAGFVRLGPRPTGDGSWIANAFIWPRLAAALESDEPRVFKDVTAEYLGLASPQVLRGRL